MPEIETGFKPYMIKRTGGQFGVYKEGADGKPTGDALGKHPTRKQAQEQMAALHASMQNEGKTVSEKCEMMAPTLLDMRLTPDDVRANYKPLGGSDTEACANCWWFEAGEAECHLVSGDVVATGICDLWTPEKQDIADQVPQQVPLPVYIVDEPKAREEEVLLQIKALGDGCWMAFWTNNVQDYEDEWFPEKAIEAFNTRALTGAVDMPELWFWHLPIAMGKADWVGGHGHFEIAAGKFYDDPISKTFEAWLLEHAADYKMSHGFAYPRNRKIDGVYHVFNTFEISMVPRAYVANPYTLLEVKTMKVTDQQRAELVKILGEQRATEALARAETDTARLDAAGIQAKADAAVLPIEVKLSADLAAVADAIKAFDAFKADYEVKAKARDERQDRMEAYIGELVKAFNVQTGWLQEQFGQAPRASKSAQTLVPMTDPQLELLRQNMLKQGKDGGSRESGGVLSKFLEALNQK